MQFLIVRLDKPVKRKVRVLINGEKNGFVNELLMLDEGFVEVGVDLPKTETVELELKNTTSKRPMEVVI
jgi:hypothetical protein